MWLSGLMNEHAYFMHSSDKIIRFSCNWWPCMKKNQYNLICAAAYACVIIHTYMRRCECVWLKAAATADFISWARDISGLFLEIFFLRSRASTSYCSIYFLFYIKCVHLHHWLMNNFLIVSELNKNPVEGFSAGLIDESDIHRWEVLIIGPPDTL